MAGADEIVHFKAGEHFFKSGAPFFVGEKVGFKADFDVNVIFSFEVLQNFNMATAGLFHIGEIVEEHRFFFQILFDVRVDNQVIGDADGGEAFGCGGGNHRFRRSASVKVLFAVVGVQGEVLHISSVVFVFTSVI